MNEKEMKKGIEIDEESLGQVAGGGKPPVGSCPLCPSRDMIKIGDDTYKCAKCGFVRMPKTET